MGQSAVQRMLRVGTVRVISMHVRRLLGPVGEACCWVADDLEDAKQSNTA